jgi:hypothetical protein
MIKYNDHCGRKGRMTDHGGKVKKGLIININYYYIAI